MSEKFKTWTLPAARLARMRKPSENPMRFGVGLPAAVPGAPASAVGEWAERAEALGFESLSVLDRIVYDNLDPLIALAAAAERTRSVELLTTILNVPVRQNAVVVAKQIASLERLSDGRVTAGLALGGWLEDYTASGTPTTRKGATFQAMVEAMEAVWKGEVEGASGPIPACNAARPGLLFGGFVDATFARAARHGSGWIAPFFGHEAVLDGVARARAAWAAAGRTDSPRIVVERYFCLADNADAIADEYIAHYYGDEYFPAARADTLTRADRVRDEVARLRAAGCTDLLLFPCTGETSELELLAEALAGSR
jgi:alkanesulfonate monooxygenase SsuD/methylene tetrahydromethanopterin reductase-like flavin-dependent oxidoreductase (luciferase family)